jgi:hypothetical protein
MLSAGLLWAITQRELVIHTHVSGQPIAPFLKGQGFLTVEVGSDCMSPNFSKNYRFTLRYNAEERSSRLLRSRRLK